MGKPWSAETRAKITAARWGNKPTHAENLWAKVDKNGPLFEGTPCWLFTAKSERKGYGVMWYEGKVCYVHRVSWALAGNELVSGMNIDHRCKRIKCVNPAHLRLVTPSVSALENCTSPVAKNAAKTHCTVCGNPLSGKNIALILPPRQKNRHGNFRKPSVQRQCLTCRPHLANSSYRVYPDSVNPKSGQQGEKT